jgi:hypothetical protein
LQINPVYSSLAPSNKSFLYLLVVLPIGFTLTKRKTFCTQLHIMISKLIMRDIKPQHLTIPKEQTLTVLQIYAQTKA